VAIDQSNSFFRPQGITSAGFDLVFGFALFVEVATVGVVYDCDRKVLYLQMPNGVKQMLLLRTTVKAGYNMEAKKVETRRVKKII
jgi:hypothetical protein